MARKRKWPADNPQRRRVEDLVPYARNARTHSEAQVKQIANLISRFGWTTPVLVNPKGGIISGHGRVLAAQLLGIEEIPVIVAEGWTETEQAAYILADNQVALNAGWDEDLLRFEVQRLREQGVDTEMMGFDGAYLSKLMNPGRKGKTDPDAVPAPPKVPFSQPGDVWLCGRHRVACGDSTSPIDVQALLDRAKPNLMVTDPPYGVEYDPGWRNAAGVAKTARTGKVQNDDRADWREAWELFPGDVAYVWHAGLHAATVEASLASAGLLVRSQIIWAKPRFAISRGHYHWQHEPCWYAVRKGGTGAWVGGRAQSTLWEIATVGGAEDDATVHGTQKPVECMRRPIVNNSGPGESVYEPFLGSGTTLIAAEIEGRRCFAMELDPSYVDVALIRWAQFTGETPTRESDGAAYPVPAKE